MNTSLYILLTYKFTKIKKNKKYNARAFVYYIFMFSNDKVLRYTVTTLHENIMYVIYIITWNTHWNMWNKVQPHEYNISERWRRKNILAPILQKNWYEHNVVFTSFGEAYILLAVDQYHFILIKSPIFHMLFYIIRNPENWSLYDEFKKTLFYQKWTHCRYVKTTWLYILV